MKRLPIRYLEFILSFKLPKTKGVIKIFQKYRKNVSLPYANGIHPIPQRRTALLPAHRPQLQTRRRAVPGMAGFRRDALRPAQHHRRPSARMDHPPHGERQDRRGVDEPRNRLDPHPLPVAAPHGGHRKRHLPNNPLAQDLAPPAGLHPREPHDGHRQRMRRGGRGFRNGTQLARHPDVLRLRPAPCRAGRHRPRRLLGRLRLAAGTGQGRQAADDTDPRIRTRKDFKLPRPNCEAKYLQFCGKSTIFNTQRKAHIAERRLPHGTGGTDPGGRTGQEKPPCAPPYVCDAPAERRSRYARDPGASGTRFVTGHAGLYAQQHRQAPGDIRKGPSPGKGREVINFYKL